MTLRDVIVVGAGPVGLSLALGLARHGVDVLVLEKMQGTAEHSRAPAIWPGTQEILASLDVLDRFEMEGITVPCIEMWDADHERVLIRLPVEELRADTPYARLLILPQSKTERFLYESIRDTTDAEVRFSSTAVSFRQDASGVTVTYKSRGREEHARGRFVVGCDGADSTLREAIGASFDGMTYGMEAALADVTLDAAEDLRFPRLTFRQSLAVAIRIDSNLWRLILPFSEDSKSRSLEQRINDAVLHIFSHNEYETVWKSEFRLHRRVSSRWVNGRMVLAGDAAHLNSPVGGQGMNVGIKDAAELTEALVEGLADDSSAPLMQYARHRRKDVEQGVNPFTDRLTRLLMLDKGRFLRPALWAMSLLLKIRPLRHRLLRRLSRLDERP